jgi:riboflavin biosynthesis pyrimidine reductase
VRVPTLEPIDPVAPLGQSFERLFEREGLLHFTLPERIRAIYGGGIGFAERCLFANFVASLDGVVGLPGDKESGQIISGKSAADRFVMGLLRACADAVVVGAGTFRKAPGHLWRAESIYPAAAESFAQLRRELRLRPQPLLVLVTGSGSVDPAHPALRDAWVVTTRPGAAKLAPTLPDSARLVALEGERVRMATVLERLHGEGYARVLTEGGPSLFAEVVKEKLLSELFLTLAPALFGRHENDGRLALAQGQDLSGARFELASLRRHGSLLFLRYVLER